MCVYIYIYICIYICISVDKLFRQVVRPESCLVAHASRWRARPPPSGSSQQWLREGERKRGRERGREREREIPLAFEPHGRMSEGKMSALRRLTARLPEAERGEATASMWLTLSVALQWKNASAILLVPDTERQLWARFCQL